LRDVINAGESGQTMAEYGVVLAMITLAIVASFGLLSGAIESAVGAIADIVDSVA
jgi:Flp pilus assembly pilin Flp